MLSVDTKKYTLFYDESECEKTNFLYHGYLYVSNSYGREILEGLTKIKAEHHYESKEIHFSDITSHSEAPNGSKSAVALDWIDHIDKYLRAGEIKFYFFGVDKNNLGNFWENGKSFNDNAYIRFFEIGFKSSIRWFMIPELTHLYLDKGKYEAERAQRIRLVNYRLDSKNAYNRIDPNNIIFLDSNSKNEYSNLIQLCDVLLGSCRLCFTEIGKSKKGQRQCVDKIIDVVERFNDQKKAYNPKSSYYKKFNLQFFPSENNLSKEVFLNGSIERYLKDGKFYCDRHTHRQKLAIEKRKDSELKLNFE